MVSPLLPPITRSVHPAGRGSVRLPGPIGLTAQDQVAYHVYGNGGSGPIDYSTPIATVSSGTTYTTAPLTAPGEWKFGVRAFWSGSELEEQNLDCAVKIILDAAGNDVTNRPAPPVGLRAFATANAGIVVEWFYPFTRPPRAPTDFRVYIGAGTMPDYSRPAATVPYSSGFLNTFQATLAGLANGTTYTIAVRAYNQSGEEPNTIVVSCTADATGPKPVDSLKAVAIV